MSKLFLHTIYGAWFMGTHIKPVENKSYWRCGIVLDKLSPLNWADPSCQLEHDHINLAQPIYPGPRYICAPLLIKMLWVSPRLFNPPKSIVRNVLLSLHFNCYILIFILFINFTLTIICDLYADKNIVMWHNMYFINMYFL